MPFVKNDVEEKLPRMSQVWSNRTLIGHKPLICSKMRFTKTEFHPKTLNEIWLNA